MANEETWLSISEAAKQLEVHPRTLRRYIRDGKLNVLRLSHQVVRVRVEDIEAFLDDHIKVETGTGTCYVPTPRERKRTPAPAVQSGVPSSPAYQVPPASPAKPPMVRFG